MKESTKLTKFVCYVVSLLCCSSATVLQTPVYLHTVYVNNTNTNASDTDECGGTEMFPCSTLSFVLKNRVSDSTQVVVNSGGNYTLNESVTISNMSLVAVTTAGSGSLDEERVTVTCTQGAGLSFVNCFNVTLFGLKLMQCSALQESTSRNFSSSEFSFMRFPVSLYFLSCQHLNLTSVTISGSSGTGLAVYATSGQNYFQDCTLTHNGSPDNDTYPSAGGMYIEFPFCDPHNPAECESEDIVTNNDIVASAEYEIAHSKFEGNTAHMWHPIDYQYLQPETTNHLSFGNGGGLSVFFSRARDSVVRATHCRFEGNSAEWGGGTAIEFQGMSWNNTFTMESCIIQNNTALTNISQSKVRGGGGVKIRYTSDFQNSSMMAHNNLTFINCTFRNNTGFWGGGVLLRAVREEQAKPTNSLEFLNCLWEGNLARVGSALDLAEWDPVRPGASLAPRFISCNFSRNNDIFKVVSQLGQPISVGSVYTHSIPLLFDTSVLFDCNNRSAIAAVNTLVEFRRNCCAVFTENEGRTGGAIALFGTAFIRVHNYTNMTFVGNTASQFGGAIYYSAEGQHELDQFGFCFIQYRDFTTPPWNWTSMFYFSGNKARFNEGGNSIYSVSLIPCLWSYVSPNSQNVIPGPRDKVFCWGEGGWTYEDSNCSSEVSSAPGNFNHPSYHMKMVLGKRQRTPITIWGDKWENQTSNAIFNLWSHSPDVAQIPVAYNYVSDNTISIHGTPERNATLAVETISPRPVYTEILVEILPCPPGFHPDHDNNSDSRCFCYEQFGSVLQCNQETFTAKLRRGLWMGNNPFTDKVVVGVYPYTRNDLGGVYFELAGNMTALDKQLCGHAHRKGPFCAQCIKGYAPSINSLFPRCVQCSSKGAHYYWLLYVFVEVVPVTIFLIIIMLFHISVTRGAVNSFVLFAQLVTTTFDITGDGTIPLYQITSGASGLQKAYRVIYNFWNLNFFISVSGDFCLSPKLNTITILSFHYLLAFYSLALIFVFYWLVRLYEHGVQPFYTLGKPIHYLLRFFSQRWNLNRSTVDAFSTFLVLSSTKFTVVSVYLLTTVTYIYSDRAKTGRLLYLQGDMEYLSRDHMPFFVLAVFVMTTFVLLPTLLLLVYPLRLLEKLATRLGGCCRLLTPGNRMRLFLDTFQGCFKDGTDGTRDCRYFAGVYFLLRTVLFTSYAYTGIWFQQYVVQQLVCTVAILLFAIIRPYKKDFYNNLDAIMLGILALINALSMYNIYYASQGFALLSWAFALQYILIYCPLIYIICYAVWKMLSHRKALVLRFLERFPGYRRSERQPLLSNVVSEGTTSGASIDEEYRQFANEVEAFGRDRERNCYRPMGTGSSGSDTEESGKDSATTAPDSTIGSACVVNRYGNSTSGVSSGPQSDL